MVLTLAKLHVGECTVHSFRRRHLGTHTWGDHAPLPTHQVTVSTCGSAFDTKLILATDLSELSTYVSWLVVQLL